MLDGVEKVERLHPYVVHGSRAITKRFKQRAASRERPTAPINEIAERWINRYDQRRVRALSDLKRAVEDTPMAKPEFVYTSYIHTTPQRLCQTLIDPAFTQRYRGMTFEPDWNVGSTTTLLHDGATIADPAQIVLESEPYRRLAYTWHTITPEWAEAHGFSDEFLARVASEPRSKVTFTSSRSGNWPSCRSYTTTSNLGALRSRRSHEAGQ